MRLDMIASIAAVLALLRLSTVAVVHAEDPYLFFDWNVTYGTISPLGVPQRGILINGQFPGPNINSTTNNNVVVNIHNNLEEPLLITWNGIQQRKNSWMDGMPGTNCPILPGSNHTYHFQVKDQIGTYFYYPSIGFQKAAGGFGGLRVNSRLLIPVPFDPPADDYTILVGDWYTKDPKDLVGVLKSGRSIGRPAGILINGKNGTDRNGKDDPPMFTMEAGKTYRYRMCNVGLKASVNVRFQGGHTMKLVEMDGSHVVQNVYESLDVHAGQCCSVLVTADKPARDYYLVASTRFQKQTHTCTAVVRYAGSTTPPEAKLPEAPVGWQWSLNQWRTFRWNLTASAARPNPQGSFHYGQINITRTIILDSSTGVVNGSKRYALNGVSHVDTAVPLKLAEYYNVSDRVFKYDLIGDVPPSPTSQLILAPNVIKAEFRTYIEIILQNSEKSIQSYHLNGYSFFSVGMGPGKWKPENRKNYNLMDAVSRHSVQVYPKSWSAIMATFDNAGMWSLRSNIWERYYLGQQMYVSVTSPARSVRDEYTMLNETLLCGFIAKLPIPPGYT